jgi:hypothetical protein
VDKVVRDLFKKAKRAGRKLMRKLGIGSKEKPKNKEQHDEQVKAGLQYLDQLSEQEDKDKDGNLSEESASKIAKTTKNKFKVFTSVIPKLESGKWVFNWTGSGGKKKTNKGGGGKQVKGLNSWKAARLKLIPDGEKMLSNAELEDYDQAQKMTNEQILKKGATFGDGTSAFIAMLEQYRAGPGNPPFVSLAQLYTSQKLEKRLQLLTQKLNCRIYQVKRRLLYLNIKIELMRLWIGLLTLMEGKILNYLHGQDRIKICSNN